MKNSISTNHRGKFSIERTYDAPILDLWQLTDLDSLIGYANQIPAPDWCPDPEARPQSGSHSPRQSLRR